MAFRFEFREKEQFLIVEHHRIRLTSFVSTSDFLGQRVLDMAFDRAAERTPFRLEPFWIMKSGVVVHDQRDAAFLPGARRLADFDVDDPAQVLAVELAENDHIVNAVREFV